MDPKCLLVSRIQIVPMWSDPGEPGIHGNAIEIVQKKYFKKEQVSEVFQYFYHGTMINMEAGESVLVLFQYKSNIIAYGIATDRIPVDKIPADGIPVEERMFWKTSKGEDVKCNGCLCLKAKSIFCVEPISEKSLNKALAKPIEFGNAKHILKYKTDQEFLSLFKEILPEK